MALEWVETFLTFAPPAASARSINAMIISPSPHSLSRMSSPANEMRQTSATVVACDRRAPTSVASLEGAAHASDIGPMHLLSVDAAFLEEAVADWGAWRRIR
jgi:hypothetical protein